MGSLRSEYLFYTLAMPIANSTQTLSFRGMTNQYDAALIAASQDLSAAYPGATYIRVKYLDRDKNRLSCTIKFLSWPGHKIHIKAYGFDNLKRNIDSRIRAQPDLLARGSVLS